MHKASSVELRTSIEMAHSLAQIGIRFVPIPVETDEEASIRPRNGLQGHTCIEMLIKCRLVILI